MIQVFELKTNFNFYQVDSIFFFVQNLVIFGLKWSEFHSKILSFSLLTIDLSFFVTLFLFFSYYLSLTFVISFSHSFCIYLFHRNSNISRTSRIKYVNIGLKLVCISLVQPRTHIPIYMFLYISLSLLLISLLYIFQEHNNLVWKRKY